MYCEWRRHYGWLVTAICHLQFILGFGAIGSYVLLYVELEREFKGATALALGWVAAVAWGLSSLMSVLTSPLYERFGHQKVITIGVFLTFFGILGTTFAPNLWVMYVTFGVILGGGFNFCYNPSMNLVTAYFPKSNCTRATAIATIGAPMGLLILCPVLDFSFHHIGWRNSYRVLAGIYLLFCLPLCYFMNPPGPTYLRRLSDETEKEPIPESEKFIYIPAQPKSKEAKTDECNSDEEKKGQYKSNLIYTIKSGNENSDYIKLPKNERKDHEMDKFIISDQTHPQKTCDGSTKDVECGDVEKEKYRHDWRKYMAILALPQHWLFFFGVIGTTLAAIFNAINLGSMLTHSGYDEDKATILITGMTVVELLTRVLIAAFGDCLPFARCLLLPMTCAIAGVGSLVLGLYPVYAAVIVYLIGAGIGRGVMFALLYGVAVEVFGAEKSVEVYTSLLVAFGLGGLLGSTVPGLSFDLTGSYAACLNVCAGIWIVCGALYIALYICHRKDLCNMTGSTLDSSQEDIVKRIEVIPTAEGYEALVDENMKNGLHSGAGTVTTVRLFR